MHTLRFVFASLLAATAGALGDGIPAQPIGLLDKDFAKNSEQNDFFLIHGRGKGGQVWPKLVFSAKVNELPRSDAEQRALFVQELEFITPALDVLHFFQVAKESPLKRIGTFTVGKGTRFDSFLPTTDTAGNAALARPRFDQMFFHVPGRGLFVTEGGGTPKVVRAENKNDPSAGIKAGVLRLSDYVSNNPDVTLQSRLFFGAKDGKKGFEPFIYGGTAAKVLKDINPAAKGGSDAAEFAALGPQNATQHVFFTAKDPVDGMYQLWLVLLSYDAKNRPVYDATPFTFGAGALQGKPEHLIANESDLFFAAPLTAGGTPVLWHLAQDQNISPAGLEHFDSLLDPQQLTLNTKNAAYSRLVLTVNDGGARHYARWSSFDDAVTILSGAGGATDKVKNPTLITDAGEFFYFAADWEGDTDASTFLIQHDPADDSLAYVMNSNTAYPFNIREICVVTSQGVQGDGTLYFTGDYFDGVNVTRNVLMKKPANDGSTACEFVFTAQMHPVIGAKNLRAVVDAGSGIFRLYFSAPVNSTTNAEFIPANSAITNFGTKPFVTAESGN